MTSLSIKDVIEKSTSRFVYRYCLYRFDLVKFWLVIIALPNNVIKQMPLVRKSTFQPAELKV
jgi:hypothetical protein